jgi:hypothetical protein
MILHNIRDGRQQWIGAFEVEPLVYNELQPEHVGRTVIYQQKEAGTLTSWRDGIVFARYSQGNTAAGARADDLVFAVEQIGYWP